MPPGTQVRRRCKEPREVAGSDSCYFYEISILNIKAFVGLLFLLLVMAALLFIPAWTLDYWQAWTFLAVYFAWALAITLYLMKRDPRLLQRRMSGGPTAEKEPTQKIIMLFTSLGFISLMIFPALDHRFAWSRMTPYLALIGDMLVSLGWLAIFLLLPHHLLDSIKTAANARDVPYQSLSKVWLQEKLQSS